MTVEIKDIVRDIRALDGEIDMDDLLAIPPILDLELMVSQLGLLRNSARLALNNQSIVRVAGRRDEARKLGEQASNFVRDMRELMRRFPGAMERLKQKDAANASNLEDQVQEEQDA